MPIKLRHLVAVAALAVLAGSPAAAAPDPYSVLEPLVGEWDVGPAGGPPAFVERCALPRFGVEGTRRLTGVYDRPLIGAVVK